MKIICKIISERCKLYFDISKFIVQSDDTWDNTGKGLAGVPSEQMSWLKWVDSACCNLGVKGEEWLAEERRSSVRNSKPGSIGDGSHPHWSSSTPCPHPPPDGRGGWFHQPQTEEPQERIVVHTYCCTHKMRETTSFVLDILWWAPTQSYQWNPVFTDCDFSRIGDDGVIKVPEQIILPLTYYTVGVGLSKLEIFFPREPMTSFFSLFF